MPGDHSFGVGGTLSPAPAPTLGGESASPIAATPPAGAALTSMVTCAAPMAAPSPAADLLQGLASGGSAGPALAPVEAGVLRPPSLSGDPREILVAHMRSLEQWALDNQKDARRDSWSFWAFKAPAILASASAGVWAHFGWVTIGVVLGAIASLCVIVDGIYPRGMLRNTHLRAVHDLRDLTNHMWAEFDSAAGPKDEVVRTIIREAEQRRRQIAKYVRDADTALNYKGTGSTP